MAQRNDHDYFLRREQESRAMAANSSDPMVTRIHLDFAENYRRAAERLTAPLSDAA